MFRTYFAKVNQMGFGERLVGVVGETQAGLLRIVDVDIRGNPVGEPTYIPGNVTQIELTLGKDGMLIEDTNPDEEIDWAAHEVTDTGATDDEAPEDEGVVSDGKVNPAMAAFPELQG